jgi:hypothetical protein
VHDVNFLLSNASNMIDYAVLCGDTQLAVAMYIVVSLWWRRRTGKPWTNRIDDECPILRQPRKMATLLFAEWLDHYVSLLRAAELYVTIRELQYVVPFAGGENPALQFSTQRAMQRGAPYVYCGYCSRGNLEVKKNLNGPPKYELNATCERCHSNRTHQCVICEEAVAGEYLWLRSCGHGGHPNHIEDWLRECDECPKCGVPIK